MIRSHRFLTVLAGLTCAAAPAASQQRAAERGWVGISVEVLASGDRAGTQSTSVTVTNVSLGSPAARAGIRAGDVLVSVNGAQAFPRDLRVGDTVRVTVQRDGRRHEMTLAAAPRPLDVEAAPAWTVSFRADSMVDRMSRAMDSLRIRLLQGEGGEVRVLDVRGLPERRLSAHVEPGPWTPAGTRAPLDFYIFRRQNGDSLRPAMERAGRETGRPFPIHLPDEPVSVDEPRQFRPLDIYVLGQNRAAGAEVVDLRPELAEYFGVSGGVLVVDVAERTPAALAGIQPGDVLTDVGSSPVRSIQELRAGLSTAAAEIPVTVVRKGRRLQVLLKR